MRSNVRWWLRSLAVGAVVGLASGLIVGGLVGRVFMRLLFLAQKDTRGIETAMGAIIGDFTAGGTLFIGIFGGFIGLVLGIAYVAGRALMPRGLWRRELWFVLATCGLLLGLIIRLNREDFAILPVTLSLLLIAGSVLVTALPCTAPRRAVRSRSRSQPGPRGTRCAVGRRGRDRRLCGLGDRTRVLRLIPRERGTSGPVPNLSA